MNGISLLKCICDETRFEILELLQKNNELCVNDFVNELLHEHYNNEVKDMTEEEFQQHIKNIYE